MVKKITDTYCRSLIGDFIKQAGVKTRREDVLVFVPVHNEQESISNVINGIRQNCRFDILVIDDGSVDSTPDILNELGVEVLKHPAALGSRRILHGLEIALALGYRYAIKIDGDGQHDPRDIMRLYETAIRYQNDLVIGSRHAEKFTTNVFSLNGSGMWFCSRIVSVLSHKRMTDTTSGFKIWSQRACQTAIEASRRGKLRDASTFHIEELVVASRKGLKVEEISVKMLPRYFGKTKSFSPGKKLVFPFKLISSTLRALL